MQSIADIELSVFVRNPQKFEGMDLSGVNVIQGDALKPEDVKRAMEGQDVLLCSLDGNVLPMAQNIAAAVEETSVKRIIWITGMGIHHEIRGIHGIMLNQLAKKMPEYITAADTIAASSAVTTLLHCPGIRDGEGETYRLTREGEKPACWFVDRAAIAQCMADMIADESLGPTRAWTSRTERCGMKKILILEGSPRLNGNSCLLSNEFARGAEEAGCSVEKIAVARKRVAGCLGCNACYRNDGVCVQKDDMVEIREKMLGADVIVLASPIYFYSMTAQLKAVIDRSYAFFSQLAGKTFYFIISCAAPDEALTETMQAALRGFTCCVPDSVEGGVILGIGANDAGDVRHSPAMEQAYQMGRSLAAQEEQH